MRRQLAKISHSSCFASILNQTPRRVNCPWWDAESIQYSVFRGKKSRSVGHPKAAEGNRTPRRFARYKALAKFRQVVECGCPLPLSLQAGEVTERFDRNRLHCARNYVTR